MNQAQELKVNNLHTDRSTEHQAIQKLQRYTHAFLAGIVILGGLGIGHIHGRVNEAIEAAQAICIEIDAIDTKEGDPNDIS